MIRIVGAKDFVRPVFASDGAEISRAVRGIIDDVKARGDDALRDYTKRFDGVELSGLEVAREEIDGALSECGEEYSAMLRRSAENIRLFHEKQLRTGFVFTGEGGAVLGQRVIPLQRVGIYVPGGLAAYPSTVLMNAIPAVVAGCGEVVMVTPPPVRPQVLAAACVAGVHRVFTVGGAQAVAGLAYGTETLPKVDKITGPGNVYVAEAKRQVFGEVAIDMVAGPSEILIIADGDNSPAFLAADMLAQAEHDVFASSILITDSQALAENVRAEIERQISALSRGDIARKSVDNMGRIVVVGELEEAVSIANNYAPEHLELCVGEPFAWLGKIRNAGSVFLGKFSPEAVGDYCAGPNHTLPTMGTARFSSPLGVEDLIKTSQFMYFSREGLGRISGDVEMFAQSEGLTAHANSVHVRRDA